MSIGEKFNSWAKGSITLKLFIVGILILVLLIPSSLIDSLIYERKNLRDEAQAEVSSKWGINQTIGGPVISVPFQESYVDAKGFTKYRTSYAHFLPDQLDITGEITPDTRNRGIYVVVLYNGQLSIKGNFDSLSTDGLLVDETNLQWEKALVSFGIRDLKGVQQAIKVNLNGQSYDFGPGTITRDLFESGISLQLPLTEELRQGIDFDFQLDINGSQDIHFLPLGKETNVSLTSNWADPSFEGFFLPDERTVNETGFTANWKVLQLNRNYPQQGQGKFVVGGANINKYDPYKSNLGYDQTRNKFQSFGIRFLLPVDEYQKTQRSSKYSMIFIFVTFLTFFFIEILNNKRLHPIQYLLVGAAIILFYVLLLSISEHFSFNMAYALSCVLILSLITFYAKFILKNSKLTFLLFFVLATLYGFFYALLQLQDYALLLGSIGLLIILATIMFLTRNVDWYGAQTIVEDKIKQIHPE